MTKFNVGDSVNVEHSPYNPMTVKIAEPDHRGLILLDDINGYYRLVSPARCKPIPAYPERWVNVWISQIGMDYKSRASADGYAGPGRIGVIHLAADGTLTMEQP